MSSTRSRKKDNLIGQSNSFMQVIEHVRQVAALNKPVLIIGERGTGKELIAERLHYLSQRWDQNYLTLNCATLNESLLESELFGHESGAFTGASKRHAGRFERADGGTLFLDELANTSGVVQEKLLRVIEYGEFERVGGSKSVTIDTRLIAATNEDLPTLAEQGEFRADLLDRLAFDVITLPPLRERPEDIMLLAEHFAINMARQLEMELFSGFTRSAQEVLQSYDWPGNVRELKNAVERSVYRHNNAHLPVHQITLDPFDSPYRPRSIVRTNDRRTLDNTTTPPSEKTSKEELGDKNLPSSAMQEIEFPIKLKDTLRDYEIELLRYAMQKSQFNQRKAADALDLTYHQLRGILKKYSLLDEFR
ncbi:phage shock protein operon transcriptional activator [Corallincola holothuriorum]|uniref:Phage shock protein operon transcriptional activator n=1 Tax=Corallincola holothuriorum TaxID=2282215 RepID=A0A368N2B5_9GAMM|nr:phage shock protein operon transcriptional activator [Corallincola holothuriorum]RCU43661.1 phage shock protein operon transcriptional activator [Corallincola holothuriorum]